MKQFRWRFVSTIALMVCQLIPLPGTAVAQNATALNFGMPFPGGPSGSRSIDPGVRGGAPGAGGPYASLNDEERAFFTAAQGVFTEIDLVPKGLGPRFNLDSCAGCHAAPAVGGSSPATNPQVAVAKANGATNVLPSFITLNSPVREARFVRNPDGTPDGGVHDLFVITGRKDAPGCDIKQPDFAGQVAKNNVVFRIPTPIFGLGLVESVPDSYLQATLTTNSFMAGSMGISGEFNRSGNDGTITRFGGRRRTSRCLFLPARLTMSSKG